MKYRLPLIVSQQAELPGCERISMPAICALSQSYSESDVQGSLPAVPGLIVYTRRSACHSINSSVIGDIVEYGLVHVTVAVLGTPSLSKTKSPRITAKAESSAGQCVAKSTGLCNPVTIRFVGIALTTMTRLPTTPSLVAVIVTMPGATPVTTPIVDTVALATSDDAHTTVRP